MQRDDPDNPEWTAEDFAHARQASCIHGPSAATSLVRKRGRPRKAEDERKKQVTLRLSPDVLSAARKTGPGWQARVDQVLRVAFAGNRNISMADLGAAIVKSARGNQRTVIPPTMPTTIGRKSSHEGRDHKHRA